jgi:competence protein ComEA
MLKKFFKNFFSFTRSEKNGLIVLVSLIMLLIIARLIISGFRKDKIQDFSEFQEEIDEFEKSLTDSTSDLTFKQQIEPTPELFFFDPNTVSDSDMHQLGLNPVVIRNIIKYRDRGGEFHKKEDLMKIYGLDTAEYLRLETFIQIRFHEDLIKKKDEESEKKNITSLPIPINLSDSANLIKIKGIGPVLSSRIIKYRNLLGGYVRKEQLLEVYGLTDERFEEIRGAFYIDTVNVLPVFMNEIDENHLSRHPYLNLYQARALIRYREINGRFVDIDEIRENQLLPNDVFNKIKPYLRVD